MDKTLNLPAAKMMSFRARWPTRWMLKRLADDMGLTMTAVLQLAIEDFYVKRFNSPPITAEDRPE